MKRHHWKSIQTSSAATSWHYPQPLAVVAGAAAGQLAMQLDAAYVLAGTAPVSGSLVAGGIAAEQITHSRFIQTQQQCTIAQYFTYIGSRALSFKRPLLSVDLEFCLSVCPQLWGQISRKRKVLGDKLLWGVYRKVVTGYRMVTSRMTSRDPMTS